MKQQTVGICLVSGDSALRDDVQAVLDRLNHWLGHETPAASQSWPDNDPQCLYRQVAEQAQAYVREHAESHGLYLDLQVFGNAEAARSALGGSFSGSKCSEKTSFQGSPRSSRKVPGTSPTTSSRARTARRTPRP